MLFMAVLVAAIAASASSGAASHTYSVEQVRSAFESAGIALRGRHASASARYARLASPGSLHVIVFRSERDVRGTIEVILGSRPRSERTCRNCIVVQLAAPDGSAEPRVQHTEFANVVLVYEVHGHLGSRVNAALAELRS
jgi:hypothetical protein